MNDNLKNGELNSTWNDEENIVVSVVQKDMDILRKKAEVDRAVVDSTYKTLMENPSIRSISETQLEQLRSSMKLEGTWEYIEELLNIIDKKDKRIDSLTSDLIKERSKTSEPIDIVTFKAEIVSELSYKKLPTGKPICRFTVKYVSNVGPVKITCDLLDNAANYAANNLKPGDTVEITGFPTLVTSTRVTVVNIK